MPKKGISYYQDLVFGNQEIEHKNLNDLVNLLKIKK